MLIASPVGRPNSRSSLWTYISELVWFLGVDSLHRVDIRRQRTVVRVGCDVQHVRLKATVALKPIYTQRIRQSLHCHHRTYFGLDITDFHALLTPVSYTHLTLPTNREV